MSGRADGAQIILLQDEPTALAIAASINLREQQFLQFVYAGLSNWKIAAQWSVSDCTVKTCIENVYRKIGVSSRTQATAQAQARGFV